MNNLEALPITALIPETAKSPIVIYESHAALRMAIVEKNAVGALQGWDNPGVYCLLYPVRTDETFPIYVGQAPAGLRTRVLQHVSKKDDWVRALLIARDTTHEFHSAQVGWLEGLLWSIAFGSARGELVNKNQPKDEEPCPTTSERRSRPASFRSGAFYACSATSLRPRRSCRAQKTSFTRRSTA